MPILQYSMKRLKALCQTGCLQISLNWRVIQEIMVSSSHWEISSRHFHVDKLTIYPFVSECIEAPVKIVKGFPY